QWPFLGGANFAVNPVDGTALLISAVNGTGRVFRTSGPSTGTGVRWFEVANLTGQPNDTDGTHAEALAFGSPRTATPGVLNDFMYVGTNGGNIYVTTTGGGTGQWRQIGSVARGLDGTAIQSIAPNPRPDSNEVYAVTAGGVYWLPDSSVA